VATLVILVALLAAAWWYGRQPPKARKGKAGIGICIDAGSSLESRKVRDHFVRTIRRLIKTGEMSETLVPWKRIGLKKDPHCDLKGHANHRTPQTGVVDHGG
jgi:hypothetical protein